MTNRQFQAIMKELFIRCTKLIISLVFITQCYFSVPKDVTLKLNSTHYLIMKTNSKRELQNIAINYTANLIIKIYEDLQKVYKRIVFFFDN